MIDKMVVKLGKWLAWDTIRPDIPHLEFDDRVEAIKTRVDGLEARVDQLEQASGAPRSDEQRS